MKVGYIRVSTQEQNTVRQEVLMQALGVEQVFIDRMSGKNLARPELAKAVGFCADRRLRHCGVDQPVCAEYKRSSGAD